MKTSRPRAKFILLNNAITMVEGISVVLSVETIFSMKEVMFVIRKEISSILGNNYLFMEINRLFIDENISCNRFTND